MKNTRARMLIILVLLTIAVRWAHGQSMDAMPRSTNAIGSDLLMVQTNSAGSAGRKFTTSMTLSNFLEVLKGFANWPSGLGTLTTVRTNGANISAAASSVNFIEGTNIILRATNTAGAVTVQINAAGGGGSGDVSTAQLLAASNAAIATATGTLKSYSTNIATLPSIFTNTIYVNATGATATINGTLLTNAWKSTLQNVEFVIGPGDYYAPTNTIPSTAFSTDNRRLTFLPGARWIVGSTNEDTAPSWNFDDSAGKRTNIWITGMGTFINSNDQATVDVMILENGSRIFVEHASAYNHGGGAILTFAGGSNHVDWITKEKISSEYDLFYFNGSDGNRLLADVAEGETWSDLLEVTDDSPQWGLINVHFRSAICTTNSAQAVELENSFAMLAGRVTLRIDTFKSTRTISSFRASALSTTDALLDGAGGVWSFPSGAKRSVIQQLVASAAHTGGIHLRGAKIEWPAALDPFTLTNSSTSEVTLENISLNVGSGATNWVRGATPSRVRILGSLSMNRPLPVGGNITLVGTNQFANTYTLNIHSNGGAMYVAGQFTGSGVKVTGILDVDGDAYVGSLIVSNIFLAPLVEPTGIEGEIGFDINHWASGRGALKTFDGTEVVALVAVPSSPAPSAGQVPHFNSSTGFTLVSPTNQTTIASGSATLGSATITNTVAARNFHHAGGTIPALSLLRTDSGTNSAAVTIGSGLSFDGTTLTGTSSGTIGPGALGANANQFDTNGTLNIKTGALVTNLSSRGVTIPILTTDRAIGINGSGNITNSQAVTLAELEFVDGVTSAIQTQLNGKQNGKTNANQFGASTTLTIASGALVTNLSSRGVTIPIITASRALAVNASGNITNSQGVDLTELEYLDGVTSAIQTQLAGKQNGQTNGNQFGASTTITIASGALTTNAQIRGVTPLGLTASRAAMVDASGNLTNVTSGSPSTEYVKADGTTGTPSGGSGGTNFPPAINQLGSTNLDVSGGVRKVVTITTNASFAFNLASTPANGMTFLVSVSNYSASTIYLTTYVASAVSSAFLPSVASNASVFAIAPTSIRWLEFLSETNFNLGTARWNIIRDQTKEPELTAGYATAFATNSAGTYITNGVSSVLQGLHANAATTVTNVDSTQLVTTTGKLTIKPAAIVTNLLDYAITTLLAGVGGANTNFTLLATNVETTINGFTNVSLRAVMSYVDGVSLYSTVLITNGSGSDRTLEFSAVTNRYRFAGTYGTNAPTVLTNATQLLLSLRSLGTNTLVGYSYFPWP